MNYLAHSFLTFTDGQIVGQFLEDFIRNKDRFLSLRIFRMASRCTELLILSQILTPPFMKLKKFAPLVRLYAGAFVDVAMDYFVANDLSLHSLAEWKTHSLKVYRVLNANEKYLKISKKCW
jgi:acyl carrier protein phosphodiesterase